MTIFRYPAVITLALWSAFAPAAADAQERAGVQNSLSAPRAILLPVLQDPQSRERESWLASSRLTPNGGAASSRVPSAQTTGSGQTERGVASKVFGAIVGGVGGFFAGGYLGAAIEGDRCHCDDPGLKGALIGAPVGAVAGGILGARYLF